MLPNFEIFLTQDAAAPYDKFLRRNSLPRAIFPYSLGYLFRCSGRLQSCTRLSKWSNLTSRDFASNVNYCFQLNLRG